MFQKFSFRAKVFIGKQNYVVWQTPIEKNIFAYILDNKI